MRHVTQVNEVCHTSWLSHARHIKNKVVMHVWMGHNMHMNESYHMHECVVTLMSVFAPSKELQTHSYLTCTLLRSMLIVATHHRFRTFGLSVCLSLSLCIYVRLCLCVSVSNACVSHACEWVKSHTHKRDMYRRSWTPSQFRQLSTVWLQGWPPSPRPCYLSRAARLKPSWHLPE